VRFRPATRLRGGASVTQRYEFIDAEYAAFAGDPACAPTVVQMCKWLEVSRSGFYDWRSRPESEAAKRRELLKIKVKALFEANGGEYGYRRMHRALLRGGERCSPGLARRLMRELGLEPCQPGPWRHSLTEQDFLAGDIPDLVRRDFTAERPGQKMVGDITYIPTWQGWLYLATVIDCATRKIAGWAMADNYKTPLIISAVEMAARNLDLPGDAVFHSDRGSNYTSGKFAGALKRLGIRQSVGRTGICYDNALAESVNASLKVELVHRTVYPTLGHARKDIARWIELRYNRTRLHSGLGYRTPQEVMDEPLNKQVAA
jgi:putative transposase